MSGAAAGGAAAANAAVQAIKASGIIVRVHVREFRKLLDLNPDGIVVHAMGGVFSSKHKYLMAYKGLAFFTIDRDPLTIPGSCQLVEATRIWVP